MACTQPQCLYTGALYLTSVPVHGCTLPYLSACTRVHFTLPNLESTVAYSREFLLQNNSNDVSMSNTVAANEVSQQQELPTVSSDDENHSLANGWENVSRDTCQWSLLIGQLEDVALLDTVVR